MISCIVVDDEPIAREILEEHISKTAGLLHMGSCGTALQAFDMLHVTDIQLMFLDVHMPGINGIDFLKSLKNPPKVIFTTAYSEHAVTAFELDAIDYLMKPVTYERFQKSIRKAMHLNPAKMVTEKNYTYFRISGRLIRIEHHQLLLVKAVKDYVLLQTTSGNYLTHMGMKGAEQILPASTFTRVHRSYLINNNHIREISKTEIRISDELIPIGESYRNLIVSILGHHKI